MKPLDQCAQCINYNCRGLPNHSNKLYSRPVVKEIFNDKKADSICFQETWYSKQDLAVPNNLHPEFHGIGESTVDNTTGLCHGHAPGGVAIMWRDRPSISMLPHLILTSTG